MRARRLPAASEPLEHTRRVELVFARRAVFVRNFPRSRVQHTVTDQTVLHAIEPSCEVLEECRSVAQNRRRLTSSILLPGIWHFFVESPGC